MGELLKSEMGGTGRARERITRLEAAMERKERILCDGERRDVGRRGRGRGYIYERGPGGSEMDW